MIEKISPIEPKKILVPTLTDLIEQLDILQASHKELIDKNTEIIDYINQVEKYLGRFGK